MHPGRLRRRAPSARILCPAALAGHQLRFHKHGRDGSGKCDAWFTGAPADWVHGALYDVCAEDRAQLDRAEDLGRGYQACPVSVAAARGVVRAFTYLALPGAVVSGLRPFDWYLGYVLAGARFHGLPADYVAWLAATGTIPDPDPRRSGRHAQLVSRLF